MLLSTTGFSLAQPLTTGVSKYKFKNEATDDARLANATEKQRADYEISPFGIHWEELDEDLSLKGFFEYNPEKDYFST